jgi:hypothetical protein
MVSSTATTVTKYLASLPADRRAAISRVRDTINANLPAGYAEGMFFGMIGWYIPLERYPDTYNGQPIGPAALASQKNYMALYLTSVYGDPELERWFKQAYAASGKKLDMGKSCVRFKTLDALPLDVVAETIRRVPVDAFIAKYEAARTPASPKAKSARVVRAASKTKSKSKPNAKSKAKPAKSKPAKSKSAKARR